MPAWQSGIMGALTIVLGYAVLLGLLLGARKLTAPHRASIRWKAVRYGVPTAGMVILTGALASKSDLMWLVAFLLNLPAFLLALPIEVAMLDELNPYALAPVLWLAWYVIVRLIETPTWRHPPLSLGLPRRGA